MRSQVAAILCSLLLACAVKPPDPPEPEEPRTPLDKGAVERFDDVTYPDVPEGSPVDPPVVIEAFEADHRRARGTAIAMFGKTPCSSEVAFCIDATGATRDITTVQSCSDADLDAICRDTVAQWRFEPARLQGEPTRMCAKTVFNWKFS